jgi:hypothetical protein
VGRSAELTALRRRLDRVTGSGTGTAITVRGRRQVGKSRLAQEFCDRAGVPYVFSTAVKGASQVEAIGTFLDDLRTSTLAVDPGRLPDGAGSWLDAFRALAGALPDGPVIVVLDEVPWLAEQDSLFDGSLQAAWDRLLSRRPVLLLLMGSDIHLMERLTAYDQPFFGRADSLTLGPLNPAETAAALSLPPADAIDAHLVSGGLPGVLRMWPDATPALDVLREEAADPASPLFSIPESVLLSEFPAPDHARRVLEAVGGGDRTFANIAAAAGGRAGDIPSGVLSPQLHRLVETKRVLALDQPLSTRPGRPALYRVADTNLRFYLSIGRTVRDQAQRGRTDAAVRTVESRWTSWRGRAVEPLVREALELAAVSGRLPWPDVEAVGGWWPRGFDPEIDLVGADRAPVANRIRFAGSVKWLGRRFEAADLEDLRAATGLLPGFGPDGGLVVVSLNGVAPGVADAVRLVWGPDDVVGAWRSP